MKNNIGVHAPVLEDFGLDFSVYSDYEKEKQELKRINDQNLETIKSIENKSFAKLIEGIIFYIGVFLIVYIFSLFHKISWKEESTWGLIWIFILFAGWVYYNLLKDSTNDFYYNLVSFGKYKKVCKLRQKIGKKLENLENMIGKIVEPFEKTFYDYYQDGLDEFYSSRLYKKRSGTAEFEESLAEFSAIINDLSEANKVLLTKSFDLWEYENYLKKRKGDHLNQQNKVSDKKFLPLGEFVKNASEAKIREEKLTPEEKYRIPRKIDWENINKSRQMTGLKGEEIVVKIEKNYLQEVGRINLAERVRHVAKEDGDGAGYDVLSFFKDGREKYIEVKSTTKSLEVPYYISRNELSFLQEHTENSFIYRLLINHKNIDYSLIEINSAADLFATKELEPVQYVVKKLKFPIASNSQTEAERY